MINNNVIIGSSAFYLPNCYSKEKDIYFYQLFKQALENGYKADDALRLARQKINSLSKEEEKQRKVEDNKELDNNTQRRK